jgi:hypothetical protein
VTDERHPIAPTEILNGSGVLNVERDWRTASDCLLAFEGTFRSTTPHPRDYQNEKEYRDARAVWCAAGEELEKFRARFDDLSGAISMWVVQNWERR